jgi:phosphatidylserine/phosphatidylglycerophosphate/cardiolipin synthase-like enzyme
VRAARGLGTADAPACARAAAGRSAVREAACRSLCGVHRKRGLPDPVIAGAKMHAKLAVADRAVMLVTSANLTQSGVAKNIEAGLLVRGGSAPRRAAEYVDALRAKREISRLD